MIQVAVFVVLVLLAVAVALVAERRRPAPPTRTGYTVPDQLDRADFVRPDAPWLVVLFSSATCSSCAAAREVVTALEGADVAVQEAEVAAEPALHERYAIDAVPTTVVADADGVVVHHVLGAPAATDAAALRAAVSRRPDRP